MARAPGKPAVGRWLRALRAFSFPLSVLPVWIATAAAAPLSAWEWDVVVACTLVALTLHSAGNLLNDYPGIHEGRVGHCIGEVALTDFSSAGNGRGYEPGIDTMATEFGAPRVT